MEVFSEHPKNDHLLSRVDARVKLSVSLLVLAMVLSYKGLAFPLFTLCISLVLCMGIKVRPKVFFLRFSEPVLIAFVVIMIKFLFSGQDAMFSINPWGMTITGHKDGLMDGLQISSRILGAVSVLALLGFSTPFTELMSALSWLRIPRGLIEILMFAYRYIFVLSEDALVIYNAQKNRLGYSSIRRGLSSFGVLAGSLAIKAFDSSQNTATAMIQRGYDGSLPLLKQRPLRLAEVLFSLFFVVIMGIIWNL
jgi:cobalt/nickel transport system permease protein